MEIMFEAMKFDLTENTHKPGLFGENIVKWFVAQLSILGYSPRLYRKDWGWQLVIEKNGVRLFVGITNIWKDMRHIEDSMLAWKCFTGYSLSNRGKLMSVLGKLNVDDEILKLNWAVKQLLSSEDGIKIISIKEEV